MWEGTDCATLGDRNVTMQRYHGQSSASCVFVKFRFSPAILAKGWTLSPEGWGECGVNTSWLHLHICSSCSSVSQEAGLRGLHQQILLPSGWGQPSRRQRERVTQDIYSQSSVPVGPHCTGFVSPRTWLFSNRFYVRLAPKAFGRVRASSNSPHTPPSAFSRWDYCI